MPEFFSEYAKAYLRGETLQLVEYRSLGGVFPLFLDLDVKCEIPEVRGGGGGRGRAGAGKGGGSGGKGGRGGKRSVEGKGKDEEEAGQEEGGAEGGREGGAGPPPIEEVLNLFLPGICDAVTKFLKIKGEGPREIPWDEKKIEGSSEVPTSSVQIDSENSENPKISIISEFVQISMVSVSGTSGKFSHAQYPKVNYKYGFHFIFPKILAQAHQQKSFFGILVDRFAEIWDDPEHGIPEFISRNNKFGEIFDHPGKLRMLYSAKILECKKCRSKNQAQKKHGGPQNKKGPARGAGKNISEQKNSCDECGGTGLRDFRIYKFFGVFNCSTREWNSEISQILGEDISGVRRKVELCSISKYTSLEFIYI
jgi:hypothetical protein